MMRLRQCLGLSVLSLLLVACSAGGGESSHDHLDHEGSTADTGPHGGRVLTDGDLTLEWSIFERGVPAEFRVYPQFAGRAVPAQDVDVSVTLERVTGVPGGRKTIHRLRPSGEFLRSLETIEEPHSFRATIVAVHQGRTYRWIVDSPEGQVTISAAMAAANGLTVAAATPGVIRETLMLYGAVVADPQGVRKVSARFPGLVRSVRVNLGDRVAAGQTLATLESDDSLQVYALSAPISGVITQRAAQSGEHSGTATLFEVTDSSRVAAELSVFPRDRSRLRLGQRVEVRSAEGAISGRGTLGFLSAGSGENQALTARVLLDNRDGRWIAGQFATAEVTVGESSVPLVVPLSAVQTYRGGDAVFVNVGERYQALPVVLGRRDGGQVEVLGGLEPGARVVVANAFLVKADIEKSGAAHDH